MRRTTSLVLLTMAMTWMVGCSDSGNGESVVPGVNAMVFVKRAFIRDDGTHDVAGGSNQTIDYLRYTPGTAENPGGVFVLRPPTPTGELINLTASFDGVDINGIDLSFDATQVAFSMRRSGDSHYHLYIANIDGSAPPQQLTFGDYDDVKPVFVPGDRIAFVTNQPYTEMGTRADEYNHSRVVSQIATISEQAGDADRRLCSQNLSHTADLFLLSDGRIAFSRWEHLGPVNDVKLFAMNPDCTQMVAIAGQHDKPGNSLVQVEEISTGRYIGIVTSRERTIQSGAIVLIDSRSQTTTDIALDEQNARFDVLTPQVPTDEESPASGVGRYRAPFPLDSQGSRYLVSWSDGDVNDRNELAETAPNFGLYLWDGQSLDRTLVYDDPDMWDLYGTPVVARVAPPVHPGAVGPAPDVYEPAVLGSVDITITSLDERIQAGAGGVDGPLHGLTLSEGLLAATKVRVIEGFSSEIGPVTQFGLTMHEGAAILGEVPVQSDGSWEAAVPALLPYHLQPLDEFGMSIRNQLTWIQAMPGEQRRCGGCHESRTERVVPRNGQTTMAQQIGPVDLNIPIPDRMELPWAGAPAGNVQQVLNARCASCHSGGAGDPFAGRFYTVTVTQDDGTTTMYEIPYLDLSDNPISVEYEDEVVTYPAGYVTLLYPSAMMGDSVATGDVPPEWVRPGAARDSALIRAININSENDANEWAWDPSTSPHGGVIAGLTRDERLMLIRMADLGGQYWSRKNVEGFEAWQTYMTP